jgi:dTDP-4-amino-4,6-dideoxygalactose transaminase
MSINIPFNNFQGEHKVISKEINSAINDVINSGWFVLGEKVKIFEEEFAKYIGTKFCVGCASGTEAIALSLMSFDIKAGDEVITTDITAFPTIVGILMTGAKPVVVDIKPDNGLMDCKKIEGVISPKTKAVIPVHLYGQCVDMASLKHIANKHNLLIVEDCAQSAGSEYKGKKAGTFGEVSAFSFYPTKNLGAYGDGGAVCTDDKGIYDKLLAVRNYGQTDRYHHDCYGINSRLDEIQAAILSVKLKHLDKWNSKRNEIASYYTVHLDQNIAIPLLQDSNIYNTFHLFVIKTDERDALQSYLEDKGIMTLIHYPIPVRKQNAFKKYYSESYDGLWESNAFTNQILSIPINPWIKESEMHYIVNQINSFEK